MAERGVRGDVEIAASQQGRLRKNTTPEPFAENEDVWGDAFLLIGEHAPCASQADRDLIKDEQRAVAIAGLADGTPVLGVRQLNRGATDGLGDDRRDIALMSQRFFDRRRARQRARTSAAERARGWCAGVDVRTTGEEGADAFAENRFAADGDGVEPGAVKRPPHRNKLVPAGGDACELHGDAHGERTAGRQQNLREHPAGQFAELLGQTNGRFARVPARAEWELIQLLLHRLDDPGVRMTDLVGAVAVEVEQFTPSVSIRRSPRAPARVFMHGVESD